MLIKYIQDHTKTVDSFLTDELVSLWQNAHAMLLETLQTGHKIFIAGNGGSAADAQHFAAELTGRFLLERNGYPAIALSTDTSALTAIANDYGFKKVFSRQLDALAVAGDCFVGITTSGNSENIVESFRVAKEKGVKILLLSGNDGGLAKNMCDVAIIVPSSVTSHIQEVHQIVYHAWCQSIETILNG